VHAVSAATVAIPRSESLNEMLVRLGFDCAPFSAMIEYGEYNYDEDNLEE
jgi:hypothetical protein